MVSSQNEKAIRIPSVVDENTRLPEVKIPAGENLEIDLGYLKLMNSAGIRHWIQWLTPLTRANRVQLIHCPLIFVNLSAIVVDVVPAGASVRSFTLNYFCDETDEEIRVLFQSQGNDSEFNIPEKIVDPSGSIFEFDGLFSKTFARFKGKISYHPQVEASQLGSLGGRVQERLI